MPFFILGILLIALGIFLALLLDSDFLGLSFIGVIVAVIFGAMIFSQPYRTRSFIAQYDNHLEYLNTLSTKTISNAERMEEINSLNVINAEIRICKQNEKDFWVGAWTKKIGYLPLISFDKVPQGVDVKQIDLTK